MSKFVPANDERIHIEGRSTYIKSSLNATQGYAFLTSKQLVFCGSIGPLDTEPQDNDVLISIPIEAISGIEDVKHGLSKKAIISTTQGEEFGFQFATHEKWVRLIKDPAALQKVLIPKAVGDEAGKPEMDWYYEEGGKKIGPISSSMMKTFVQNNHTIYRSTRVWKEGMPEWCKAEESELLSYFVGPPPLNDSVNNVYAWGLSVAPFVGVILGSLIDELLNSGPRFTIAMPIGLTIAIGIGDEMTLNAAGYNVKALKLGKSWLAPIYLYKRSKALKQNLSKLIVWVMAFGMFFTECILYLM